jgi:hypothetical protein
LDKGDLLTAAKGRLKQRIDSGDIARAGGTDKAGKLHNATMARLLQFAQPNLICGQELSWR